MTKRILAWLLAMLVLCAMPHAVSAASPASPQGQQGVRHVLEGFWRAQIPQEQMVFQFQGDRYAFFLNGQPIEEGTFAYLPDGRLQYQITAGPSAGQQGVNRIVYQGQSFAMYRPNGSYITYQRQASQPQPQPGPAPPPSKGAGSLPDRALSSCATSSATANTSSTNATAPSCRAAPSR